VRYQYALSWQTRAAFTLIEILVVIAIIAILASLLLVGVMAIMRKGPEVRNRNDILQLNVGLQKFKDKFGFYPPSKIKLVPQFSNYNLAVQLDQQSNAVLGQMWPNIDRTQIFAWAGPATMPATGVTLEGHECLVFFLGGISDGTGPTGFYTNPLNPTKPGVAGGSDKYKFLDFDAGRCVTLGTNTGFYSYLDAHAANNQLKKPFAYFSSYKRANGYSPFGSSDNASLGVSPYIESSTPTVKYYAPDTYQIISAGANGVFGPGGVWTPGNNSVQGKDDISNFYTEGVMQ
jgi:prepilin-type N-terminal cleavage/methylation domain-containing protein